MGQNEIQLAKKILRQGAKILGQLTKIFRTGGQNYWYKGPNFWGNWPKFMSTKCNFSYRTLKAAFMMDMVVLPSPGGRKALSSSFQTNPFWGRGRIFLKTQSFFLKEGSPWPKPNANFQLRHLRRQGSWQWPICISLGQKCPKTRFWIILSYELPLLCFFYPN